VRRLSNYCWQSPFWGEDDPAQIVRRIVCTGGSGSKPRQRLHLCEKRRGGQRVCGGRGKNLQLTAITHIVSRMIFYRPFDAEGA
jgi:hypothetical protein